MKFRAMENVPATIHFIGKETLLIGVSAWVQLPSFKATE